MLKIRCKFCNGIVELGDVPDWYYPDMYNPDYYTYYETCPHCGADLEISSDDNSIEYVNE